MKGLLLATCLLITTTTHASTYRWVDENGQTHFGDRPPATVTPSEVTLNRTVPSVDAEAAERKRRVNEFLEQSDLEREKRNKAEAKQKANAAKHEARCNSFQARLKHLKSVSGIYRLNSEGERVFVDDKENERIRREFQAKVQSECKT